MRAKLLSIDQDTSLYWRKTTFHVTRRFLGGSLCGKRPNPSPFPLSLYTVLIRRLFGSTKQ